MSSETVAQVSSFDAALNRRRHDELEGRAISVLRVLRWPIERLLR